MTVADYIRAERNRRNLSQRELDALAGFSRNKTSDIERGVRDLHVRDLYAIARALGCDARDLLPTHTPTERQATAA